MFQRQNQKSGKKNKDVQKEVEAENKKNASKGNIIDSVLNTGNENAGKILLDADESGDDLFGGFNDAVKDAKQPANLDESGDDLFGSLNDAIKNPGPAPAEKKKKEAKPEAQKKLFDMEDDEDDNIFGGSFVKAVKKEAVKEAKKEAPKEYGKKDPAKNLYPGEKPAKQELYQDPADMHDWFEIEGDEEDLDNESLFDFSDDLSMKNLSRKKKNNKNWRLKRAIKKKKAADLNNADQTQERIAGLNLTVKKLDKRNKAGGFSRFLTNLAIFAGGTIGAAIN